MNVADLDHIVRHVCHVVDVFSKLLRDFDDYCLSNMSDTSVVGIVFRCFLLENYKNIFLPYSIAIKQYFCVEESVKKQKNGLNAEQRSLHDCTVLQQICESLQKNWVLRLSSSFSTKIIEF